MPEFPTARERKFPTARERDERFGTVYRLLWQRLKSTSAVGCKLGCEPRQRRSDRCSVCRFKPDLEIDHAVAQLVSNGTIVAKGRCPYQWFTIKLIHGLLGGPGAEITAREGERIKIGELTLALKHIGHALQTVAPNRVEVVQIHAELKRTEENDPYIAKLTEVIAAEAIIKDAVKFFKESYEEHEKYRSTRLITKRGEMDFRGIAASLAEGCEDLVGTLPGSKDVKFHNLLQAAWTTFYGPGKADRNWEWFTRQATELVRKRKRNLAKKN